MVTKEAFGDASPVVSATATIIATITGVTYARVRQDCSAASACVSRFLREASWSRISSRARSSWSMPRFSGTIASSVAVMGEIRTAGDGRKRFGCASATGRERTKEVNHESEVRNWG